MPLVLCMASVPCCELMLAVKEVQHEVVYMILVYEAVASGMRGKFIS